jgi:hypothetical protein
VLRESWSISLTATAVATTTIICRPVHLFSPALSLRLSPNPCSTPALDSLSVLYGHSDLFPYMITIFSYSFFFLICFCFLGDFFWQQPNTDGQADHVGRMAENFETNGGRRSREEEHDSRSGSDNMDGGTTRTQPTTLRERSVTTDTHHSKSKNSKRMVFSYKLHSIFLLYIYMTGS